MKQKKYMRRILTRITHRSPPLRTMAASEGELGRTMPSPPATDLSEIGDDSSLSLGRAVLGEGGWTSPSMGTILEAADMSKLALRNRGSREISVIKVASGWYSLTVDREDSLECDCELLEDDM